MLEDLEWRGECGLVECGVDFVRDLVVVVEDHVYVKCVGYLCDVFVDVF